MEHDANAPSPWLPQSPPPLVFVLAGWLLVLLAAVVFIFAVFVPVPEVETGSFTLEPQNGFVTIQVEREGVVEQILVREGDSVEAGQTIAVFRSPNLLELVARRDQQLAQRNAIDEIAQQQITAIDSQIETAQIEKEHSMAEIARRKRYAQRQAEVVRVFVQAEESQLTSITEMNEFEVVAAEAEADLLAAESTLARLERELAALKAQRDRIEMETARSIEQVTVAIQSLNRDLADVTETGQEVRSTVTGTVTQVFVRQAGTVIQRGERLFSIAPAGDPLIARVQLAESSLPRLNVDQSVRLSLAAFPFQRYGMADGHVTWLSPQRQHLPGTPQPYFVALVEIPKDQRFDTSSLRAGMAGQARIVVGERTLIEYAFEPIRALREQMRASSER